MARTTNYLNNRDLLIEIHKSKNTFCWYEDPKFSNFDEIIDNMEMLLDVDFIKKAKANKVQKLKKENPNNDITVEDILTSDLVFRYMTFDHIPVDSEWSEDKEKKKSADGYVKVKFPPFQHFIIENGTPRVVGLSHWKDGNFNSEYGKITDKLGIMFMLLVEKISKKGNWRNYTYIDEMKSSALVQLSQVGLQFDESRGQIPNPFAFYTTVVNNAFKRILNIERRNRDIRDDLIEIAGQSPSFSRQMEEYDEQVKEQEIINEKQK